MNNFTDKEIKELNQKEDNDTKKAINFIIKGALIVAVIFSIYASCMLGYTEMVMTRPLLASIVLIAFTVISVIVIKRPHKD